MFIFQTVNGLVSRFLIILTISVLINVSELK